MPFQKGRTKTGGRQKGTGNRLTASVREYLEQCKCNPIMAMADVLNDRKAEPALKLRAAAELARYVWPQLRSIELRTSPGAPLEIADVTSTRELFTRRIAGIAARSGQSPSNQRVNGPTDPAS